MHALQKNIIRRQFDPADSLMPSTQDIPNVSALDHDWMDTDPQHHAKPKSPTPPLYKNSTNKSPKAGPSKKPKSPKALPSNQSSILSFLKPSSKKPATAVHLPTTSNEGSNPLKPYNLDHRYI
jgi:hypothetical protein